MNRSTLQQRSRLLDNNIRLCNYNQVMITPCYAEIANWDQQDHGLQHRNLGTFKMMKGTGFQGLHGGTGEGGLVGGGGEGVICSSQL